MRTRLLVPLLTAGALVLAGCAEEDGTATPGDAGGPAEQDGAEDRDEAGEADDPGGEDGSPDEDVFHERAEALANAWPEQPEELEPAGPGLGPVLGVAEAGPDDTELTLQVGHGSCDLDWGGWVHETDDLVIVGGWSREDPEVEFCDEMLNTDDVDVSLDSPLGDRTVVDAVHAEDPREDGYQG